DLNRDGSLIFSDAFAGHEQIAVHIGVEARDDVAAIPAKAPGHVVGDFGVEVLSATLHLNLRDVEEQTPPRTIGLTEMPLPIEATQILRPERDVQMKINRE